MFLLLKKSKEQLLFASISRLIVFVLSFSLIFSPTASYAQSILNLPIPGTMIAPSSAFVPVLLKGMTVHPEDPLKFDFIIDSGNTDFTTDQIKEESERLVKYFLASMTVPKDDLWVNLSPYENDRIIPEELGKTELGRDMLAQDYILKQLTASLMHPEKELGKKFWDKVYARAEEQFGTREIPVNTFNKVWILPETATVYEHEQTVYIVNAHLKVMLDSDYQAMQYEKPTGQDSNLELQSSIIKEIIIPEIEREVNQGEHFAPLRQIYHSLILAKWYKETVKNSLLSQVYADKNLIAGVESEEKDVKDKIYAQYMEAYKKGVFNFIKEDYDTLSQEMIPRKYFSGGLQIGSSPIRKINNPMVISDFEKSGWVVGVALRAENGSASSSSPIGDLRSYIDVLDLMEKTINPNGGIDSKVIRKYKSRSQKIGRKGVALWYREGRITFDHKEKFVIAEILAREFNLNIVHNWVEGVGMIDIPEHIDSIGLRYKKLLLNTDKNLLDLAQKIGKRLPELREGLEANMKNQEAGINSTEMIVENHLVGWATEGGPIWKVDGQPSLVLQIINDSDQREKTLRGEVKELAEQIATHFNLDVVRGTTSKGIMWSPAAAPKSKREFIAVRFSGDDSQNTHDNLKKLAGQIIDWMPTRSNVASSPVASEEKVGGIDLNKINVDRQGSVDIQFNPVKIQEIIDMGITGFAPVIINLAPLSSILPLLGLKPEREEDFELSSLN